MKKIASFFSNGFTESFLSRFRFASPASDASTYHPLPELARVEGVHAMSSFPKRSAITLRILATLLASALACLLVFIITMPSLGPVMSGHSLARGNVEYDVLTVGAGRVAYVYRPRSMKIRRAGGSAPAVFVLHGSDEVAAESDVASEFQALAQDHAFLLVYPETKVKRASDWDYREDVGYISALVQRLQEQRDYRLDAGRLFVCGHSAGGSFALFLQNEIGLFSAAAAVEAGVGYLEDWDLSKQGKRTMLIWNHADPVLTAFAPTIVAGGEPALFNLTISTLRRHGSLKFALYSMPTSETIVAASSRLYPEDGAPQLSVLSFRSHPGSHAWARTSWCTFSATKEIVNFFALNF